MLTLTRAKNEALMIGNTIKIIVLKTNGLNVSLGFEVPKCVQSHREEIYARTQPANFSYEQISKEKITQIREVLI